MRAMGKTKVAEFTVAMFINEHIVWFETIGSDEEYVYLTLYIKYQDYANAREPKAHSRYRKMHQVYSDASIYTVAGISHHRGNILRLRLSRTDSANGTSFW